MTKEQEQINALTLELLAARATLEEVRELLRDALQLFGSDEEVGL